MIAVTGANGLVGSFIVRRFVDEGLPVLAITRRSSDNSLLEGYRDKIVIREADVLDAPAMAEALKGAEVVVHAAALVSFNPRLRKKIFEVNVEGTRNVINICLALNIPRFIHVSSVAALGRKKGAATVDETSQWAAGPLNTDYSESKYRAELEVYRGMEEGLDVAIINPSVVLAPADWRKSSARLFHYAWQERPFYAPGSFNYVDVRDVAEMVLRLYRTPQPGHRFVANAGSISFKEFFDTLAPRLHKKPPYIEVGSPWLTWVAQFERVRGWIMRSEPMITMQTAKLVNENMMYDNRKAHQILKMEFVPLTETLDWCCDYYLRKNTTNK